MTGNDDSLLGGCSQDTEHFVPGWLADIEERHFRTAHDTGANPAALLIWNLVRRQHGLPPLTEDALWERHADTVGWDADQLVSERENWAALESWEGLVAIRDAYRAHEAEIAEMPNTNQEFFAQLRTEGKIE